MRAAWVVILVLLVMGCSHTIDRVPGTIGPCYGSIPVTHDINGCLYDTNYDGEPDIVLFHGWDGEKMVLISARTIEELHAMMEEETY